MKIYLERKKFPQFIGHDPMNLDLIINYRVIRIILVSSFFHARAETTEKVFRAELLETMRKIDENISTVAGFLLPISA